MIIIKKNPETLLYQNQQKELDKKKISFAEASEDFVLGRKFGFPSLSQVCDMRGNILLVVLGVLLILTSLANAAPSDYVQLISPPSDNCGFASQPCESIYKITNPTGAGITVNEKQFKFLLRTQSDLSLATDKPFSIQKMQILIGQTLETLTPLDPKGFSFTFQPSQQYYLKFSASPVWRPSDTAGEQSIEPFDNVLSAFGHEYTEYAWAFPQLPYRRQINITNLNGNYTDAAGVNITFNSYSPISQGKMANNCSDLRFTYYNSTTDSETVIPFYLYADVGLYGTTTGKCSGGNFNAVAHVRIPFLMSGVNSTSLYYYYGNSSLSSNMTNATYYFMELWNYGYSVLKWENATSPNTFGVTSCQGCALSGSEFFVEGGAANGASRINNVTYPSNYWDANKSVIFLYKIVTTSTNNRLLYGDDGNLGWSLGASTNSFPTSYIPIQVDFNASRVKSTRLDTRAAIDGYDNTADVHTYFGTWSQGSGARSAITNITIGTYFPIPLNWANSQENNTLSGLTEIRAYDQQTMNQIIFNATFTNSSFSFNTGNILSYTNDTVNFQGAVTILIQNASYYSATLHRNMINETNLLTVVLNPKTNPNLIMVRFHVVNLQGGFVANALVSLTQNGYEAGSAYTDSSGTVTFYLDSTLSYAVSTIASGYQATSQAVTPVTNDYTITLGGATSYAPFVSDFSNIFISLTPDAINYAKNWTIFNYTVLSTDSQLAQYGLYLYYNGVPIFSQINSSPASGGSIVLNASTAGRNGNFTINYFFRKTGSSTVSQVKVFQLYSQFANYSGSLSYAASLTRQYGASPYFLLIPILMITAYVISWLNRTLSIGLGLGVFAMIILLFGMNFITQEPSEYLLWGFVFIVALAIVKLRSGQ